MTDISLLWSILGSVLVVGVSYGGLYSKVHGVSDRIEALEREVRKDEAEHALHVNDVVDRLARIERNIEILVKKAGF